MLENRLTRDRVNSSIAQENGIEKKSIIQCVLTLLARKEYLVMCNIL
jgi:hypothetical protein